MKYLLGAAVLALSAACTSPSNSVEKITPEFRHEIRVGLDNPAIRAFKYIDYTERTHRAELRELTGVDPVRTEWCAAFVNAVLEESDIVSNNDHKYPLTARAFLQWGTKVTEPKPGDIVVFPRGNSSWQGHVGFYLKTMEINGVEYYLILGGNQSNKVSIVPYRASRALGIRRNLLDA
jgi:uncharacterized protein (TIGR02594 family)